VRAIGSGMVTLVVVGLLALGAVASLESGRLGAAVDAFVLYLGALGLAAAVRATSAARPAARATPFEPPAARETPERPAELQRLERDVDLSLSSWFYLHQHLLPILREVARTRLLVRHGIDLHGRPEAARSALGDETWAWVRPDREVPRDRWQDGPSLRELRAVVDAIEKID